MVTTFNQKINQQEDMTLSKDQADGFVLLCILWEPGGKFILLGVWL